MFFFVFWRFRKMKNIQLLGVILVIIGSFLPLVHIPIVGNWNYWKLDYYLAGFCWVLCAIALLSLFNHKIKLGGYSGVTLLALFIFTIAAVKIQTLNYFSFLPLKSWQETFSGIVKLQWGWVIEFLGGILLSLGIFKNNKI